MARAHSAMIMGSLLVGGGKADRKIARDLPVLRGLPHRDERANPKTPAPTRLLAW
jgi:hypothetical protein